MQNCQYLQHTNGCNKYCCKYCVKVDQNNVIDINSSHKSSGSLINQGTFLHNTKITRSAMNEEKAMTKKRSNNKPHGRAVAITYMLHTILGEKEVHTDMNFVTICTLPLEFCSGYSSTKDSNFYHKQTDQAENDVVDGHNSGFICNEIRDELGFEEWRRHTDQETMILKGAIGANITVDMISVFSLRPPELRIFIDSPGLYFRWFEIKKKPLTYEKMQLLLDSSYENCAWIDALQQQVYVKDTALKEIEEYIRNGNSLHNEDIAIRSSAEHLSFIIGQCQLGEDNSHELDDDERETLTYIKTKFVYKDKENTYLFQCILLSSLHSL